MGGGGGAGLNGSGRPGGAGGAAGDQRGWGRNLSTHRDRRVSAHPAPTVCGPTGDVSSGRAEKLRP